MRPYIGACRALDTGCDYLHRAIGNPNEGLQALRIDCAPHAELVPGGTATGIQVSEGVEGGMLFVLFPRNLQQLFINDS